jgi:hypothetical protein
MAGPYGPLWLTYEYTEYLLVLIKPYCLSPTPRYLHTTGTEPGETQVDNCLRLLPEDTPRYRPV